MSGFGYGARRAVTEAVGGIVTSVILNAFAGSGLLDPSQVLLFDLANMGGTIALILVMPFWGTVYLMGWLFGLTMMARTGLVGVLDLVVYFGIPLAVLLIRIYKWATN